jgi:hypothetical protein
MISFVTGGAGGVTLPVIVKLNGFSFESSFVKLSTPLKVPVNVALSRTVNCYSSVGANTAPAGMLVTSAYPAGRLPALMAASAKLLTPTLETVIVQVTAVHVHGLTKSTVPPRRLRPECLAAPGFPLRG